MRGCDDQALVATRGLFQRSEKIIGNCMNTTNLDNIPIRIQSGIPVQLDDHPFDHRGELPWGSLVPMSLVLDLYQKSDNYPSRINNYRNIPLTTAPRP